MLGRSFCLSLKGKDVDDYNECREGKANAALGFAPPLIAATLYYQELYLSRALDPLVRPGCLALMVLFLLFLLSFLYFPLL